MTVSDKVKVLPEQGLPHRLQPVGLDAVDWFFMWYNKLEQAGVRLPKVKYVSKRERTSTPEDGIFRLDDDGNIRIPWRDYMPLVMDHEHINVLGMMETLIAWRAMQDAGLLYEWRCMMGDNHELAYQIARACTTLSTDPD